MAGLDFTYKMGFTDRLQRFQLLLALVLLVGCVSIGHALELDVSGAYPAKVPGRTPSSSTQDTIFPEDAAKFIGQLKNVCGTVASAHYAPRGKGQPTFIYLDKPYPNQAFTVIIWGSDRGKFRKPPEEFYSGKTICVTGMIKSHRGRPEIEVKEPDQIR